MKSTPNYFGILDNKYLIKKIIGSGTSSIVYQVVDSNTGKEYAAKVFKHYDFSLKTSLKITNIYYEAEIVSNQVYIMFSVSELFFKYPIIYKHLYGTDLKALYQTTNCKTTKNEQYPQYYDFKYRPYYSFLLREVHKGYNISISDIYKFVEGNYGLSICIQFPDVISDKELVSICHDMDAEPIIKQLNSINNKIPGYIICFYYFHIKLYKY